VQLWDNRLLTHTAVVDFKNQNARRHGLRISPQAERPIAARDSQA
jgi:sulfonate dioxygenase